MIVKNLAVKVQMSREIQSEVEKKRFDAVAANLLDFSGRPPGGNEDMQVPPVEKKSSVIKDTFSMPPGDYALISLLQIDAATAGKIHNKSEIVRAGLRYLDTLSRLELVTALGKLEKMVPGRKK